MICRIHQLCNSKIRDIDSFVFIQHDIRRLEIAVDDGFLVCRGNTFTNLCKDRNCAVGLQGARLPEDFSERLALDIAHREIFEAANLTDVMNPNYVLVRNFTGNHQFVLKTLQSIFALQQLGPNHLQGNIHVEFDVVGQEDASHAAGSDRFDDSVSGAKSRTRLKIF